MTKAVVPLNKPFTLNIEDTNVAKIGSAEDKEARKEAAQGEPAWEGAGQEAGLKVWRIEQFEVKAWPEEEYGNFYEGDSYILLHTKENEEDGSLEYELYFWLGLESSTDEQGTAAYKTVELDDFLDGAATQHREVMLHESDGFNNLFEHVNYLKGGIDSGFNHVEEGAYAGRLMHVKKIGRQTNTVEVECTCGSLNQGDAFILDLGSQIYVWKGEECSPFEGSAAAIAAEALEQSRNGQSTVTHDVDDAFWEALGGEGDIKSAEDAAGDLPTPLEKGEGVLYRLSDSTGEMSLDEVGRGELSQEMLDSADVFLCDNGPAVLLWIGSEASPKESAAAMDTANKYLSMHDKPLTTPVTVVKEGFGKSDPMFQELFAA